METKDGVPTLYVKGRKQWRRWLTDHAAKEDRIWLIMYNKGHEKAGIDYATAVEEALCFGWIDSKAVKRDATSRYQFFSKRNPKSNWSNLNKQRVERLTADGLMTPAGQAMIDLAKKTGAWTAFEDVENETIPDDLQALFNKKKSAFKNFQGFPPSARKMILGWIMSAKRVETREQRIKETVEMAAKNLKAYPR